LIDSSLFAKISNMEKETKNKKWQMNGGGAPAGVVYSLGFIGAIIYYIQHADTFLIGVIGVLKAFVWPALVVYRLFQYFGF
jgi:hypothetical protein